MNQYSTSYEISHYGFVQFKEGNTIRYGQDMRFFCGIPNDVKLYPTEITLNGLIIMVGDGYGIRSEHKLPGRYGSGAIFAFSQDLPEDLILWCKDNMLSYEREGNPNIFQTNKKSTADLKCHRRKRVIKKSRFKR